MEYTVTTSALNSSSNLRSVSLEADGSGCCHDGMGGFRRFRVAVVDGLHSLLFCLRPAQEETQALRDRVICAGEEVEAMRGRMFRSYSLATQDPSFSS